MKEQGYDASYPILRGIFAAPDISPQTQDHCIEVLKTVTETAEWTDFIRKGSLKNRFLANALFNRWQQFAESSHKRP